MPAVIINIRLIIDVSQKCRMVSYYHVFALMGIFWQIAFKDTLTKRRAVTKNAFFKTLDQKVGGLL